MKTLGKIVDSFTIPSPYNHRAFKIDRNCSSDVKVGDMIQIKLQDGTFLKTELLDAVFAEGGSKLFSPGPNYILYVSESVPEAKYEGCEVFAM